MVDLAFRDAARKNLSSPRVGLGLPVFNGEDYLEETLNSIVSQSFADFELLISDNASTDSTEKICQAFADRDRRIRYFRQAENIGAAANYNFVFQQSRGEFFKWCAHDDLLGERFLEICIEWLDSHEDYVGAMPSDIRIVDAKGQALNQLCYELDPDFDLDPDIPDPGSRFADYLSKGRIQCSSFFSLFRKAPLGQTDLHGNYQSSDRVLVGEMILRGRLAKVDGADFSFRSHDQQYSIQSIDNQNYCVNWLDPKNSGKRVLKYAKYYLELYRAVGRAKLSVLARSQAYGGIIRLAWSERSHLTKEILLPVYRNGRLTNFGEGLRTVIKGRRSKSSGNGPSTHD